MRVVGEILGMAEWQVHLPELPELEAGVGVGNAAAMYSALATQYSESNLNWRDWIANLAGFGVRTDVEASFASKLGGGVAGQAALTSGSVFFTREDAETTRAYAKGLVSQSDIRALAIGYLPAIEAESWDDEILELIVQLLHDPRLRRELWSGISPEIQDAVALWMNRHKLSEFFLRGAGDKRRFDFWVEFVDHMGPHSAGRIGPGQGFFEFPGFGVVEFMETGNAAYFYDQRTYLRMLNRRPPPPNGALKDRDLLMLVHGEEGRMIHSGEWEWKWRPRVAALIAHGVNVADSQG
jgi:hypothetical protein